MNLIKKKLKFSLGVFLQSIVFLSYLSSFAPRQMVFKKEISNKEPLVVNRCSDIFFVVPRKDRLGIHWRSQNSDDSQFSKKPSEEDQKETDDRVSAILENTDAFNLCEKTIVTQLTFEECTNTSKNSCLEMKHLNLIRSLRSNHTIMFDLFKKKEIFWQRNRRYLYNLLIRYLNNRKLYYYIQNCLLLGFVEEAVSVYVRLLIIFKYDKSLSKNTIIKLDAMFHHCFLMNEILERESLCETPFKFDYDHYKEEYNERQRKNCSSHKNSILTIEFYGDKGFFQFNRERGFINFLVEVPASILRNCFYSEKFPLAMYCPFLTKSPQNDFFFDSQEISPSVYKEFDWLFCLENRNFLKNFVPNTSKFPLKSQCSLDSLFTFGNPHFDGGIRDRYESLGERMHSNQGFYREKKENGAVWFIKMPKRGASLASLKEVVGVHFMEKLGIFVPETKIVFDKKRKCLLIASKYIENTLRFQDLRHFDLLHKINRVALRKIFLIALLTGNFDLFNIENNNILFKFNPVEDSYEPIMIDLEKIFDSKMVSAIQGEGRDERLENIIKYSKIFQGDYCGFKEFIWRGVSEEEMYEMIRALFCEMDEVFNESVFNDYFEKELNFENKNSFLKLFSIVKNLFLNYTRLRDVFKEKDRKRIIEKEKFTPQESIFGQTEQSLAKAS